MPITRELTDDELQNLDSQGIDSSSYRGKPVTLATDEELSQQPVATTQPKSSITGAIGKTLSAHKGGIAGGGLASLVAGSYLLGPEIGVPATIAGLIGTALAGAGGAYGGEKIQKGLEGQEKFEREQAEAATAKQEHPFATAATDITASALASGGFPSIVTPLRAGAGVLSKLAGRGISEVQKNAVKAIALNAGVNPAINTGINLATSGQLPSLGEVGQQVAGGALFAGQSPLGRAFNRHGEPAVEPNKEGTSDTTEQPSPTRESPFTQRDESGKPLIDDTAVNLAFKEANPKPDTSGMSDVESYKANTKWRNLLKLSPEQKRNLLHEVFLKRVDTPPVDVSIPKPEPTSEPIAKPAIVETPPEVVSPPNLTKIEVDFQKAREEVAKQNVVAPVSETVPSETTPIISAEKPITENQARIINPETLLQSNVGRKQTPVSEEVQKETGIPDRNKYAPETEQQTTELPKSHFSQFSDLQAKVKAITQTRNWNHPDLPVLFKQMEDIKNQYSGHVPKPDIGDVGATVGGVLENTRNFKGKTTDDPYIDIAKNIKMDPQSSKVSIIVDQKAKTSFYNLDNDVIHMAPHQLDSETVLHEMFHAATSKKLPTQWEGLSGSNLKKAMDNYIIKGDNPHVKEIIKAYYDTAKSLGIHDELFGHNLALAGMPVTSDRVLPAHGYAMGDLHEFITAAMTDPKFQKHLNELPSGLEDGKTMWSRFVDAIRKLLGVDVKHNSMLERVLKPIDELSQMERPEQKFDPGADKMAPLKIKEITQRHPELIKYLHDGSIDFSKMTIENVAALREKSRRFYDSALKAKDNEGIKHAIDDYSLFDAELNARKDYINKGNKYAKETPKESEIPKTRTGGKIGGLFRSTEDQIRDLPHSASKDVADAIHRVHEEKGQILGKQLYPILEKAKGLTKQQEDRLSAATRYELENQKSGEILLKTKQEREVFRQEKQSLKDNYDYRVESKQPIIQDGQPRMPQRDEFYHPTTPNPKIVEVYRKGTDTKEIDRLDKVFKDYNLKLGATKEEAQSNLERWKQGIQKSVDQSNVGGSNQHFSAARRPQGIPLPEEFTRPGFLKNTEAYFHRQSVDNAYFRHMESNPKVQSAIGMTKDPWLRPIEQHKEGSIAGTPPVRASINEIKGEVGGAGFHNEKALSSLATTMFIGPGTTIHKFGSNQIGMIGIADNPYQLGKMLHGIVSNFSSGLKHATENGVVRLTARSYKNILDSNITFADRLQTVAKTVRDVYSLGDVTDKLGTGMMQAGIEAVLPNKIEKANSGNLTNQQFLKKLDPSYKIGKEYSPEEISKLASSAIGYIHGTGDARTMPPWMIGDTEVSGFFKLSHWGIAQTNRFMSDIYTPMRQGDYKPILSNLFGATVGGYLIKELREKLQGKKGQIPSLEELSSSEKGVSGNLPLVAYNMMAALSYAGFGGMLSTMAKIPFDKVYKNTSQGATFPLDEVITDTVKTIGEITTAIANDPNINWLHLVEHYVAHVVTTNFQLGRVAYNQAINNGLITGSLAEKKELSDKMGQLRRFDMAEGLPYNEQEQGSNPYLNIEQKRFKQTQDVEEAMKQLPQLVSNIVETYKDKPDVMISKLKALKENSYSTFPSMESMPLSFMKYLGYLERMKGPEEAHTELIDFIRHMAINEAKSSVVP